jgi:lysophospholipase L1-like esterase
MATRPVSGAARAVPARALELLAFLILFPPALAAVAVAALRPVDASWTLAAALTGVWAAAQFAARRVGERGSHWLLALCACALVLWPEMGLRCAGFRFEGAGTILFGIFRPAGTIEAIRDPELFWTLPPEVEGVNSHGFLGPEFRIPKPRGVFRVVFFGDSCTQQGFPRLVERRLNAAGGENAAFEAVNLGVAGYSSYQGREVARIWTDALEPDVGVVYFGWNDHWQAYGQTDAQRGSRVNRLATRLLLTFRTFQFLARIAGPGRPEPLGRQRVGLDEYRRNLEAIGEAVERAGGRVLLLTAPSSHRRRGVPSELVSQGFATDAEEVLSLHQRYNDVVRSLAKQRGWLLLDLERDVQNLVQLDRIFMRDGIHFTPPGLEWISSRISSELLAVSADQSPHT